MVKKFLIFLIICYRRYISPLFLPSCRFTPTCSQYAITAIDRYGTVKGGYLAITRVFRCHPWCKGGYDPVPSLSDRFTSINDADRKNHDEI